MTTYRNLKFYGHAYGSSPVTLDVKINGQQVFLNTVTTGSGNLPLELNTIVFDQVLFEINDTTLFPVDFGGSYSHSITVIGGDAVILRDVTCNYMADRPSHFKVPGTATAFVNAYTRVPYNSEKTPDVRSSVQIDGVPHPDSGISRGHHTWVIPSGSTLSCNLNISKGYIGT